MTSASLFAELCMQRDLAAYNCVGAIQFVLSNFEVHDFEQTEKHLRHALDLFVHADQRITDFHKRLEKENSAHAAD